MKIVKEIWKPVVGYEGLYKVSNKGRVKGLRSGKILKSALNKKGYPMVVLSRNGKLLPQRVHRLVALTFIPNLNNYPIVNHINENKTDNRVENLEWCTNKYNCNYGTTIGRMLQTRTKRGQIKYPELQGLAHKDHKEYMKRYREIKKREQAA